MPDQTLTVLGICGSLRRQSFNRGLLRAAAELAPNGMTIELCEIGDLPLYNDDLRLGGDPEPVQRFRDQVRDAGALLIATPEYNHGIPGGLKNAIDWISRPGPDLVLKYKPVAIMGAATGLFGTVRAQLALRQALASTEAYVALKPDVLVNNARQRFDERGNLTDEETRGWVRLLLEALADWAPRVRRD